jgi:hypothetical protein
VVNIHVAAFSPALIGVVEGKPSRYVIKLELSNPRSPKKTVSPPRFNKSKLSKELKIATDG